MLINARSIFNKYDELCLLKSIYRPSLICITETWLTDDIDNTLIAIDGYNIVRNDRSHKKGGGTMIYISQNYTFIEIDNSKKPTYLEICSFFS